MSLIRPMTSDEVAQLVTWAGDERWNPGLHDAQLFWDLDPEGYLALEEDGRMIGGGAIIRHGEAFGFMGLFIVEKAFRGSGLGTQLWYARRDRLLSRLRPGGSIGLDAVEAMVPFYAKGGFVPFTRHRRFQLSGGQNGVSPSNNVVPITDDLLPQLYAYDQHCFPTRREAFLTAWLRQPGAVSLACVKIGQVRGFGVMRPCLTGWKIGPLFADTPAIAADLITSFQQSSTRQDIFLDIPDNNPAATTLRQTHQLQEVFGCVRMYHGPPPELDHSRIFGITTFEVG
jgi:GNAT superfamily N-acetyltransferase